MVETAGDVNMPIIPLTRAGQEIARILPPADALEVLERVGNAISDMVISMEIRRIVGKTERRIMSFPLKTLKTSRPAQGRTESPARALC